MSTPIVRCWVCAGPVLGGKCLHCSREPQDITEARSGLVRGIRNAVVPAMFLWLVGFILGMAVVGSWARSW